MTLGSRFLISQYIRLLIPLLAPFTEDWSRVRFMMHLSSMKVLHHLQCIRFIRYQYILFRCLLAMKAHHTCLSSFASIIGIVRWRMGPPHLNTNMICENDTFNDGQ